MSDQKSAIIIGAGLVGSLWAVYLSKAGYKVAIYEHRSDMRKAEISAGKSINLALSVRGWKALDAIGIGDEIRQIAIPMYGRMVHDPKGNTNFQQYGKDDQAIYSVSRSKINVKLIDIAEQQGEVHFNHSCKNVDLKNGIAYLTNNETGEKIEAKADLIFGADGAFSAVRYTSMQKLDRFNFSQEFISDGYREILLPANEDGSHKLDKNALHIWPRGRFMLIALANQDGSFTCTLFMPHEGDENAFDKLTSKEAVRKFFEDNFPDFYAMMPDIAEKWEDHPLASLGIIRCYPWAYGKTALIGDAAHATVPFYGQGMNAGFEDCTVLSELMQKHKEDWNSIFAEYNQTRKPDGDALQDLSMENYIEMRDKVADPSFLLRKKIEAKFSSLHPDKWIPLYSQVTFSHIPYSEAYNREKFQRTVMEQVMKMPEIEQKWDTDEVVNKMLSLC